MFKPILLLLIKASQEVKCRWLPSMLWRWRLSALLCKALLTMPWLLLIIGLHMLEMILASRLLQYKDLCLLPHRQMSVWMEHLLMQIKSSCLMLWLNTCSSVCKEVGAQQELKLHRLILLCSMLASLQLQLLYLFQETQIKISLDLLSPLQAIFVLKGLRLIWMAKSRPLTRWSDQTWVVTLPCPTSHILCRTKEASLKAPIALPKHCLQTRRTSVKTACLHPKSHLFWLKEMLVMTSNASLQIKVCLIANLSIKSSKRRNRLKLVFSPSKTQEKALWKELLRNRAPRNSASYQMTSACQPTCWLSTWFQIVRRVK